MLERRPLDDFEGDDHTARHMFGARPDVDKPTLGGQFAHVLFERGLIEWPVDSQSNAGQHLVARDGAVAFESDVEQRLLRTHQRTTNGCTGLRLGPCRRDAWGHGRRAPLAGKRRPHLSMDRASAHRNRNQQRACR